jgi:hypothetical protein
MEREMKQAKAILQPGRALGQKQMKNVVPTVDSEIRRCGRVIGATPWQVKTRCFLLFKPEPKGVEHWPKQ